jgi:hypothetical protein
MNVRAGNGSTNSSRQTTARKKANTVMPPIPPSAIAHRAFELFAARGGEHGHDVDDWLRAEHELMTAARPQRPAPRRTARQAVVE